MAQRRPVPVQLAVLRMGRAGLCGADAVLHRVGLQLRAAGGALPGRTRRENCAAGVGLRQPGPVQIQRLPHRHGQLPPRHGHPAAGPAAAHRHQLLHLPDHELHHRRLSRGRKGTAKHHPLRRVCDAVSAAHRGAHRPLPDGRGRAGAPGLYGQSLCRRREALRLRHGEEDSAGQQYRVVVGGGVRAGIPHRADGGLGAIAYGLRLYFDFSGYAVPAPLASKAARCATVSVCICCWQWPRCRASRPWRITMPFSGC